MRTQPLAVIPTLILLFGLLSACARPVAVESTPNPAVAEDAIPIQVEHNIAAATSLTISLVEPTGTQRLLGSIAPGEVRTFSYTGIPAAGNYALIAEGAWGRQVSDPFIITPDAAVEWDLGINNVTTATP